MAYQVNYQELERRASLFNKKYGVKFKPEEFINSISSFDDDFIGISKTSEGANALYKALFVPYVRRAFNNYVDNKIEEFEPWTMLREFETNVMSFLREECKKAGTTPPDRDAGWTRENFFESVKGQINNAKINKPNHIEERYNSRELRLRDMRSYVKNLQDNNLTDDKHVSTVIGYAIAVENAVNSHSVLWWIGNYFIRGRAELRELKMMKSFIKEHTGSDSLKSDLKAGDKHIQAFKFLSEKTITDVKRQLEEKARLIPPPERDEDYLYTENMTEEDMSKLAKVEPKKPAELKDFFKPGYRPDLNNLEHEWSVIEKLYTASIEGKIWGENTIESLTNKEVFQTNAMRLKLMMESVRKHGNTQNAEKLLKTMEGIYQVQDKTIADKYPDYEMPEIPEEFLKDGKEKVEIIEEDNKAALSSKIEDEPSKVQEKVID